jgi:uncharacterized repeat protein (TIGR01451 family)
VKLVQSQVQWLGSRLVALFEPHLCFLNYRISNRTPFLILLILAFLCLWPSPAAHAAVTLTVSPITWNIIGLDSNSPTSGPYRFPVGARVCNSSGGTTTATVNFVWDDGLDAYSGHSYINLRTGSLSSTTLSFTGNGCQDAYFEAEVARVSGAYNKTRRYHITATDVSGTASTPTPRELFVEHLISQNRNGITSIKLNGVPIPAGGTMTLMVGNTYTIELAGFTAPQGYNQLESFINFPNIIFQVQSVSTTYSADSNTTNVPNPNSTLYANACIWENDPGSPNYRSCVGGDDKAGGTVVATYTVKIISGAGTSQTLNTLLYDFSGSSFHYNADFTTGARIASIVSPSTITIQKTFTPKAISPGGTSVMTFKLTNPTTETFAGVNFTDALPSGLSVYSTPGVSYSGCGSGAFSPALSGGETAVSFANGTLSASSVCTINVTVTAASAGTYANTTGHLFITTSTDTGNTGSDTLTASTAPTCTPNQTLANWTIPSSATNPPDLTGGIPTTLGARVSSATASANIPANTAIATNAGSNDTYSWSSYGYKNAGQYLNFVVDTRNYTGISMTFYIARTNGGADPTSATVSYNNGSGLTTQSTFSLTTSFVRQTIDFTGLTSTSGNTTFRISASGANNDNSGAGIYVDNISFTGCGLPVPAPTISKSFTSPIIKGATSTLSFTLNNNAAGNTALTAVAFNDVLPSRLSIADSSTSQCGGTLTTTALTRTIALTGGTLSAGGSCTFTVTVTGTTEGQYDNVTGYVSSGESGTSTNYATASLTVIAPPQISKSYSPAAIFTGETSTLTFTITNPNLYNSLSGISFTDTLPAGLTIVTSGPTSTCGGSLSTTSPGTITFSGGSLAANDSCTFSITVTGASAGTWSSTTTAVTSTEGGNGNTASASLVVSDKTASLDLTKQVSTTDAEPWTAFVGVAAGSDVYYRFKVYNSGDLQFTALMVSDATLTGTSVDPANCNWTSSLPLASGAEATCVVGPISATAGSNANTATAQGTYASGTTNSSPSTATYATTELSITKNAQETGFSSSGKVLHYTYVVTNSGYAPLAGPVTVADNKSTDETCPAVSTVGDGSNYLDPGESITCTATYTTTAGDVTTGSVTNTASATADGVTSNTANKTVNYAPTAANLIAFHGKTNAGKNVLNWQTGTELEIVGFDIWRQVGKGAWKQINKQRIATKNIGSVQGARYRFSDDAVRHGKVHRYKLQITFRDGHTEWSKVIRIKTP